MRPLLALLAVLTLTACQKATGDLCDSVPGAKDASLLVVGDSVSIQYTPHLKALMGESQVTHTYCNSESSSYGREHMAAWSGSRDHWHVITVNHGYWDMPGNAQHVTPQQYADNLRAEFTTARARADLVFFVTTTAVIPAWYTAPNPWTTSMGSFDNSLIEAYNAAAVAVASEMGIVVIDLYAVSLSIQDRDDTLLHFTDAGNETLARAVYSGIQSNGGI